jgi:SAM-dependent methyltransferase
VIDDPKFYDALEAHLPSPDRLDVLDAGCGAHFPFRLERPAHITGIDISPESMNRSNNLDKYIVGDIQNYQFNSNFDLIACINVLEHAPDPKSAIDNLASAARPRGIVVLGFPNPLSLKGLITKFTPHSFHIFFLKRIFGYSKAGQKGHPPFPTYLRFSLAPSSVVRQLNKKEFDILFLKEFESNHPQALRGIFYPLYIIYMFICRAGQILSLGSLRLEFSETLIVAQRNQGRRGAAEGTEAWPADV